MGVQWISAIEARLAAVGDPGVVIEGATEAQIGALEVEIGRPLPETYRQFLRSMGHSAGPLFRGSDYSLAQPHCLRLRPLAQRVIDRSASQYRLPENAFVFLVHHGYQFLFFKLGEGEDPPVYRFSDAEPSEMRIADSFSSFLQSRVASHERIAERKLAAETALEESRS
ncbi:MAG: SMI1/KNR4 family protein [Planctomycetes bacterium]|nr:SMI1/KNR4 family protein [Planctomycetota bacterium]